jgi:hypothetical protein
MKYALVRDGFVDNMIGCETEDDFNALVASIPSGIIVGKWIKITEDNITNNSDPGVGWMYDYPNDKFYPPHPFPSWKLDENYIWQPPIPKPDDKEIWLEESQEWIDCVNCGS